MYYIIVDRSGFTVIFLISRTLNWLEHVNCWYIMICIFYILYSKARILYAVWMIMGTFQVCVVAAGGGVCVCMRAYMPAIVCLSAFRAFLDRNCFAG